MGRHGLLFLAILGVLAAGSAFGASDKLTPYRPFDEPKPKPAKEILTDSRLDKRVKVFVKSKNVKQLFAELSAKTGVKIVAAHDLWGERPIIYFHKRPLRDVMTEVSGLFGYHWFVTGKPGAYEYELFEDIRHAKRRDQLRQERMRAADELLLDFVKRLAAGALNEDALKRLQSSDMNSYRGITYPRRKEDAGLFVQMGEPFLRKALAEGLVSCRFSDLPPKCQATLCERANRFNKDIWDAAKAQGIQAPELVAFTPEDMASVTVDVKLSNRTSYWAGALELNVQVAEEYRHFPGVRVSSPAEQVARDLAGLEPASTVDGKPLPEKPEITVKEFRWMDYFARVLLLGDVLQAVAEQSDMDVIADFYHTQGFRRPVQKAPIAKLVTSLCEDIAYSARYDGTTTRLRFNKWFARPLCEEPPGSLIEACWRSLAENGCISLDVQMEMASLPEKQMQWPGFGLIHGAFPSYAKDSLRLLKAFGPKLRSQAQSEQGLPASTLTPGQYDQYVQWAITLKPDVPPEALQQSVIALRFDKQINDDGGNNYKLILNLPDGSSYPARISVVQVEGDSRKGIAEWHAKDLKADIIEVLD